MKNVISKPMMISSSIQDRFQEDSDEEVQSTELVFKNIVEVSELMFLFLVYSVNNSYTLLVGVIYSVYLVNNYPAQFILNIVLMIYIVIWALLAISSTNLRKTLTTKSQNLDTNERMVKILLTRVVSICSYILISSGISGLLNLSVLSELSKLLMILILLSILEFFNDKLTIRSRHLGIEFTV